MKVNDEKLHLNINHQLKQKRSPAILLNINNDRPLNGNRKHLIDLCIVGVLILARDLASHCLDLTVSSLQVV